MDLMVDNLLWCFTFPPMQQTVSSETKSPITRFISIVMTDVCKTSDALLFCSQPNKSADISLLFTTSMIWLVFDKTLFPLGHETCCEAMEKKCCLEPDHSISVRVRLVRKIPVILCL